MAGSQVSTVESVSDVSGLVHQTFQGRVLPNVRCESPSAMLFQDAGDGDYELVGSAMVFAADYEHAAGGAATSGYIPDHVGRDPVQGQLTPVRRLHRIAKDNLTAMRASGSGTFRDFGARLFDNLWAAWKRMEIRHSIGPATALLGACESRTSSTIFVIKDAFGHTDMNPTSFIAPNMILAWYDLTATAGFDGAGIVSSIAHSTRTVTMGSATTWEPGDPLAADDLIYVATTDNISNANFETERNNGPNGLGVIVDPDANLTTVFNIAESTSPRHKPFRKASSTFDHMELTEHWRQLASHRGFPVTPATDACITFPSCVSQVARSLIGFQQQAYTGGNLAGGYTGVTVRGMELLEDYNFYQDVAMTVSLQHLFRINLGGPAAPVAEDGSEWSRIEDYDGAELYVGEYFQFFSSHRGANAALTGISTDLTDADYLEVPNY